MGSTTKKLVWFKNLYSVFIFSIQKVGFEYKKWKHFFMVFIFIENEYSGNFVNIVKYKGPHLNDVCVNEKSNFFLNKKQCQTCVWCILYPNYVFKTIYQTSSNVKMGPFYIQFQDLNTGKRKWKVNTQLFGTKQGFETDICQAFHDTNNLPCQNK